MKKLICLLLVWVLTAVIIAGCAGRMPQASSSSATGGESRSSAEFSSVKTSVATVPSRTTASVPSHTENTQSVPVTESATAATTVPATVSTAAPAPSQTTSAVTVPSADPAPSQTQPQAPAVAPPAMEPPQVSHRNPTDPSFFDDAAFLGDSVTLVLRNYNVGMGRPLGKALFLCANSYSVRHAIAEVGSGNTVSVTYQGTPMRPEDALAAAGVKKVFIMLGLNDISFPGMETTMDNWKVLVTNIRQKCPGIAIYIQSCTPVWIGGERYALNNENMDAYNLLLQAFAAENDCYFVNVAPYVKDTNGGLATAYCSDNYVHMNFAGSEVWMKVLRAFVGD